MLFPVPVFVHDPGHCFAVQSVFAVLHSDVGCRILSVRAFFALNRNFVGHYRFRGHIFIQHDNQVAVVVNPRLHIFGAVLLIKLRTFTLDGDRIAGLLQYAALVLIAVLEGQSQRSLSVRSHQLFDLAEVYRVGIVFAGRHIGNRSAAGIDALIIDDHITGIARHRQGIGGHAVQARQVLGQLHVQHAVFGHYADIAVYQLIFIGHAALDIQLFVQLLCQRSSRVAAKHQPIIKGCHFMRLVILIYVYDTGNPVRTVQPRFPVLYADVRRSVHTVRAFRTGQPDMAFLAVRSVFGINGHAILAVCAGRTDHDLIRAHLFIQAHPQVAFTVHFRIYIAVAFYRDPVARFLFRRGPLIRLKSQAFGLAGIRIDQAGQVVHGSQVFNLHFIGNRSIRDMQRQRMVIRHFIGVRISAGLRIFLFYQPQILALCERQIDDFRYNVYTVGSAIRPGEYQGLVVVGQFRFCGVRVVRRNGHIAARSRYLHILTGHNVHCPAVRSHVFQFRTVYVQLPACIDRIADIVHGLAYAI